MPDDVRDSATSGQVAERKGAVTGPNAHPFAASAAVDVPALLARLAQVRANIAAALAERGRGPELALLAASKRQPVAAICALYDAGVHDFAENYVAELEAKAKAVAATGRTPRWHLVGALQRNKAARAVKDAHAIHSVDSQQLVERLATACSTVARRAPLGILLQLRLLGDAGATRSGADPRALSSLAAAVCARPQLRLLGLMALAPKGSDSNAAFAELAEHAKQLVRLPGAADARACSMGMSQDYSAAIQAGATMVRIGTALFGARPTT